MIGGGKVQHVQILDDDRPIPTGGVSLMFRASNFDREELRATHSPIDHARPHSVFSSDPANHGKRTSKALNC
jgi:hypothetical protein